MKKLLALFALVFAGQTYAQDVPSQEVLAAVVADDQVFNMIPSQAGAEAKQEIETLQSVLAGLEGGKIAPEKVEAIFKAVESMKLNNVSEEDLIKFIKTLSAEKAVNGHTKLKVFVHLLIFAAVAVAIYKAYGWYKNDQTEKQELKLENQQLKSYFQGFPAWSISSSGFCDMPADAAKALAKFLKRAGILVKEIAVDDVDKVIS